MDRAYMSRTVRKTGVPSAGLLILLTLLTPAVVRGQGTGGPIVSESRVGYIDNAIPGNVLRFRYDDSFNNRRPSRAEFVWRKGSPTGDEGVPRAESRVDYQDFTGYLEYAATPRFSAFAELPYRFLNPTINDNNDGIGDMNAGVKYAFLWSEDLVASFQFRTYVPTGDASRGLGVDHVSLEPALLVYKPLLEGLTAEGEFRVWVPIGGTDFAGEVLRYGLGLSYALYEGGCSRVAPVVEFVGWTVLDGQASGVGPTGIPFKEDAAGDTILNAKLGLRTTFGDRADMYVGYGRALTGQRWYSDVLRVELRLLY